MITKAKLTDYRISQDHENNPRVLIAFTVGDKIYNYSGSLDKTERMSKNNRPYSFYSITRSTLEACGFDPSAKINTLADPNNKKALSIGKEFTIEVNVTEKNGKTYEQVYKVIKDNRMTQKEVAAMLGETEDVAF